MLFPGAIIIISIILVIINVLFSVSIGFIGGCIIHYVAKSIIKESKTYKKMEQGHIIGTYQWMNATYYFFYGWLLCSSITAYSVAGPMWALVEWLK
jgi:hypothetical protein